MTKAASTAPGSPVMDQLGNEAGMVPNDSKWKLVPVEPTEEMIEAHFAAHARAKTVFADVPEIWRAMLNAAPASPSPENGTTTSACPSNLTTGDHRVTGWQPIETAPRNGDSILVVRAGKEKYPSYNVVYWDDKDEGHPWHFADSDDAYHLNWPTHWVQLPQEVGSPVVSPPSNEAAVVPQKDR